jgi:hypothetical protein
VRGVGAVRSNVGVPFSVKKGNWKGCLRTFHPASRIVRAT